MSDLTVQRFPNVVLAEVQCPLDGCTASISIEGALIIGMETMPNGHPFIKIGSVVESAAVELHMVEHGIDPKGRRV